MTGIDNYIFTSERLGFREWYPEDLPKMAEINSDPRVMEFFPSVQSAKETKEFINRMQDSLMDKGYCYYAVDRLDRQELIGFIGLMDKTFEAEFTPCVDIGWRLSANAWKQGFATEGARRCLKYAFNDLHIEKIYSMAPAVNTKSEHVMKKIGMKKLSNFIHPMVESNERLRDCVLYEISKN